jgi:hypothetical protein
LPAHLPPHQERFCGNPARGSRCLRLAHSFHRCTGCMQSMQSMQSRRFIVALVACACNPCKDCNDATASAAAGPGSQGASPLANWPCYPRRDTKPSQISGYDQSNMANWGAAVGHVTRQSPAFGGTGSPRIPRPSFGSPPAAKAGRVGVRVCICRTRNAIHWGAALAKTGRSRIDRRTRRSTSTAATGEIPRKPRPPLESGARIAAGTFARQ